jgi:aspartate/glutamate racemase
MHKVKGGKTVYGASVGMLMLESRFPRILGDGGHAETWPFPMLYKVISDATPERVVQQGSHGLLDAFVDGARELVRMGADGITTSCGFLILYQRELAAACAVPVASSSLLQVASVQALLPPGKRVGVLTVSAASLSAEHLQAAGAPPNTLVMGTDAGTEFTRVLIGDELQLDVEAARKDVLDAADRLIEQHDDIGAIVLECTNMIPYASDIAQRLKLPVYDFYSFVSWFHAGLRPRGFAR